MKWRESSQTIELKPTHGKDRPPYSVSANGDRMGKVIKSSGGKFAGVRDEDNAQGPWKKTEKEAAEWVVFGESVEIFSDEERADLIEFGMGGGPMRGSGPPKGTRSFWFDGQSVAFDPENPGEVYTQGPGQRRYSRVTNKREREALVKGVRKKYKVESMNKIFSEEQRAELTAIVERMSDEARELKLYIDNDGQLYRSQTTSIHKNLMTKRARGQYDKTKAVKLWMYLVDAGAKKYAKEHGSPGTPWNKMFSKADRLQTAQELASDFEDAAGSGEYDEYIPKKYRKGA